MKHYCVILSSEIILFAIAFNTHTHTYLKQLSFSINLTVDFYIFIINASESKVQLVFGVQESVHEGAMKNKEIAFRVDRSAL